MPIWLDSGFSDSKGNPKPLSPRTMLLVQTTLVHLLNIAVKSGVLETNPFYSLDKHEKIQKVASQRDYLIKEEINALAKVPTVNETVRRAFLFCCFTGLRYSDVSTLTWHSIKQTPQGLIISLQAMKKTKKSLVVPLGNSALEWMPKRDGQPLNERVFKDLVTLGQCDRVLKRMAAAANIHKNVTFHTSRHTFATNALAAGGDLYTVSKLLGHTSINATQIYADVVMETKIDAVNKINEFFGE